MLGLLLLLFTALILVVIVLTAVVVHSATHPARRSGAYAAVRGLPFDPGDLGLRYEAWTLDRPGAKLPVWEIDFQFSGQRSGRTAVLIHGWGESRIDMLKEIEFWRSHVDRAVMYDLRGHGDSSAGPSPLGHGEVDDLLALLEELGESMFVLVGRDLGANIALAAAACDSNVSDQIAAVVALGPYSDFASQLRERLQKKEHPTWPIVNMAMIWFRIAGPPPLVLREEEPTRAEMPRLVLDYWEEEKIHSFVRKLKRHNAPSATTSHQR